MSIHLSNYSPSINLSIILLILSSVHLSIQTLIYQSYHPFINLTNHPLHYLSIHPSIYLSIQLSNNPSFYLFILYYLSTHLSINQHIHLYLSIPNFIYLFKHFCINISVYPSSIQLSIYPSINHSIYSFTIYPSINQSDKLSNYSYLHTLYLYYQYIHVSLAGNLSYGSETLSQLYVLHV